MPSNRAPITITEIGLMSLLQISDSFFPTGAFTQSYGLETYVQKELVNSKETLAQYLSTYLLEALATSDCLALYQAYLAAEQADWEQVARIDRRLAAQKLARESREGSVRTGKRMLQVLANLHDTPELNNLRALISSGKLQGHHAIVFALAGRTIGLSARETVLAYVYNTAAGMTSNAVRMIPLGQNDGQWVLKSLQDTMQATIHKSVELTLEDLGASAPAVEIRAMQHEGLYSRLFMS